MVAAAPARFNPLPRVADVQPLEVIDASDNAEASKRAIQSKWDGMEAQRRASILHYFDTIPGKFTMSEREITSLSQMEFRVLRSDIQEAVLKSVVGWHWDFELRDPLPAAQIAFGLGGYTLSQAAELAIQTFSLMPAPFREKLVKTYAIWDDLKTRGENAVSGMTVQTTISGAARAARRNYASWRTAWNALTAEQKAFYFMEVRVYPSITRVHERNLVERDYDHLPEDVKTHLYDRQSVNEIATKIKAGAVIYYGRRTIRTITGQRVTTDWPRDKIGLFIEIYDREWGGATTAERATLLTFLLRNDPHLFERVPTNYPPYLETNIPTLAAYSAYQLAEQTSGHLLGHIALYSTWQKLRMADNIVTLKHLLTGIMAIEGGTFGRDVASLDAIDGVARNMADILTEEAGRSYNLWVSNQDYAQYILKLTVNHEQHTYLTTLGTQTYNSIRQAAAIRARARFQTGQAVRVVGLLNYCKVVGIAESSRETIKYNIAVYHTTTGTEQTPTAYTISDVEEVRLSSWEPWPLGHMLLGSFWDGNTQLENRQYWLRLVQGTHISGDVLAAADIGALAARTWEGMGAAIQKKLTFLFASRGLIAQIEWGSFADRWTRLNIGARAGHIFVAMDTIVSGETKALTPSNLPRLHGALATNNFYDLPLDYIYGITVSMASPAYINRAEEWAAVFEYLLPKYNQASEEDAIYLAIGCGVAPEVAVSMVRPNRVDIALRAEWQAFTVFGGFKKAAEELRRTAGVVVERWGEVVTELIRKGREQVPQLPSVPASDELNAAWGASNYQNRYMVVVGAIGRDTVLQQYAEHDYQPPPNYIQAASATRLDAIRDNQITQTLLRAYEAAERNMDTLRRGGGETLTFIADSLNQAAAQGRNEAEGRAQRVWDALNAHVRDFVMKYVRSEIDETILHVDEWPLWANLHARAKTALTNLPDWELAKKNGAAKVLERQWPVVTPEARRSWLLGVGVPMNEGQFQAIMSRTWLEYQQVPALFTSEIINVMVNGIEGNYGDDALSVIRIKGESTDVSRIVPSVAISFGQVNVGDFLRVRSANRVHYGFAVYLNRFAPTPFEDARIPDRIYGNWNTNYFAAYDEAFRLTTENIRAEFQEQRSEGMLSSAPESDITEIVRFESDHHLPVLADGVWGRDDDIQRAISQRAPLLAGILFKAPIAVADRLLARLYPGRGDIFSNFHQNSGWGAFPAEMRSWLIRAVVLPNLYSIDRAEIQLLFSSLSGVNLLICRQWLRALGGPNLEALIGSDATWDPILFPLMVYAIRKGVLGVVPPTGTTPVALPSAPPPTPAPPAPAAPTPTPAPSPIVPSRVAVMREAWNVSTLRQRELLLIFLGLSESASRRMRSMVWSRLPSTQRNRIRRAHGEGRWLIRDGQIAISAEHAAPPAPPAPAPRAPMTEDTDAQIAQAWTSAPRALRESVLQASGIPEREAGRISNYDRLQYLTRRQQSTLRRALRDGTWEIRDGSMVYPIPRPAAPRLDAAMQWGALSTEARGRVLRRIGLPERRLRTIPFGRQTRAVRDAIATSHREGVWRLQVGELVLSEPAPPAAPPAPVTPESAWGSMSGDLRQRILRAFNQPVSQQAMGWTGLRASVRSRLEEAFRAEQWGLYAGQLFLTEVPARPAPPPVPTAPATPSEAWDRLTPAGRIPLVTHFSLSSRARSQRWTELSPSFRLRLAEAWDLREWGLEPSGAVWIHAPLTEAVPLTPAQRATMERVEATGAVITDVRPTRGGAVRVTVAPPPKPPVAAPPARRAAPEDFFEDPFRRAIEATMPQNTWPWNRAQLVVTQAELESYAASVFVNFFYAREGGHGVPVPYMLVPLTNANIQEAEGRLPALRTYRWWQRLKNAVRHRGGQALVSLQVGEFYKHGKWWRSNTVRENVGKHRHVPTTNYDRLQLEAGMKVEMEHTDDAAEALEIAKDHLDEIPDYYSRLLKMEKKALKKQEKKALKAFRHERHKMLGPVAFDFKMDENPVPASFHMAQFRSDVYPIKVIDEFLQRHAEGWVTSFQRHYNLDRLPVTKRVYIAISTDPADKHKPLVDKIIGVMGITQNRWDNIDDVFVAVHTAYRRMGVGKQMNILLFDLARKWINPETGRGARRIYLLVKDANEGSKTMVTSVGFSQIEQFLNTAGELVNRYVKDLYEPPRENP